jgi:hypothetical protein
MAPSWLENLMALSSKFLRIIFNDLVGINQIAFNTLFRNEYFIEHQWFVIVNHLFHNKKQTQRLLVKIGLFCLQQSPME